jgi:transcriptional regulator with XRE-family HTH domain
MATRLPMRPNSITRRHKPYDPALDRSGQLFNWLKKTYELKSDSKLGELLGLDPSRISDIRRGKTDPGAVTILAVHEATGMPAKEIRRLLGLPATPKEP